MLRKLQMFIDMALLCIGDIGHSTILNFSDSAQKCYVRIERNVLLFFYHYSFSGYIQI